MNQNEVFEPVIQNLNFWNFNENPEFIGCYRNTVKLGEPDSENSFDAHIFVDILTGEEYYLSASYSITKAIQKAREVYKATHKGGLTDIVFLIDFKGQTVVNGKPFNQFKIGVTTLEKYNAAMEK